MLPTDSEVQRVLASIWSSIFQLDIRPLSENPPEHDHPAITAFVLVGGAWEGAVMVQCAAALARRSAARMFDVPEDELSREMVNDALGELANMLGGNVKSFIPGACRLSLPAVVNGRDHSVAIPGSRMVKRLAFVSEGDDVLVSLLERDPSALEPVTLHYRSEHISSAHSA
jgi:chemotaxis protein CheX